MSATRGTGRQGPDGPGLGRGPGPGRRPDRRDGRGSCARRSPPAAATSRPGTRVFRAFQRPLADVRVLVVGQDPYPNPEHPIGLSFAVDAATSGRCRRAWSTSTPSCATDLGRSMRAARHGDLTAWADQGVMLLNRVLTVRPGEAELPPRAGLGAGHRVRDRAPWRARRDGPLAAILWGRDARSRSSRCSGPIPVGGVAAPVARCRRTGASSGRGRSAGSTRCSSSRGLEPVDWTPGRPRPGIKFEISNH